MAIAVLLLQTERAHVLQFVEICSFEELRFVMTLMIRTMMDVMISVKLSLNGLVQLTSLQFAKVFVGMGSKLDLKTVMTEMILMEKDVLKAVLKAPKPDGIAPAAHSYQR